MNKIEMEIKERVRHSPITGSYYISFVVLIVIPILITILIATGIIRGIMLDGAKEQIRLAHDNIKITLENEIDDATLKLSHFVMVNDSAVMNLASSINIAVGQEKYELTNKINELFNFMITPNSDVSAIHIYYKNNNVMYFKDELAVSVEELRRMDWYQQCRDKPDHTIVGAVSSAVLFKSIRTEEPQLSLVIGFAPKHADDLGEVEMVCFYLKTQLSEMIPSYSRSKTQGEMYLVDNNGNILISPSHSKAKHPLTDEIRTNGAGAYQYNDNGKKVNCLVTDIPKTPQWRVVSVIGENEILAGFNRVVQIVLSVSILLFIMFALYSLIFLKKIITPVNHLIKGMAQVETGDLDTHVLPTGQKELRSLVHSFNRMVRTTKELMLTRDSEEHERYQAEIRALQSQINPHFLVNTLNSIRFMAMVAKFDSIKNMSEALMKILSSSFRHSASMYTFKEEIDMLESYIYLMEIRYSDNFTVDYDIAEDTRECIVPRLILQPIVENSIVHGFEEMMEVGKITITSRLDGEKLLLTVADDGCGMSEETVKALLEKEPETDDNYGIGVSNVNRRIKLTFGKEYGIKMGSTVDVGTITTLNLPAKREDVKNV